MEKTNSMEIMETIVEGAVNVKDNFEAMAENFQKTHNLNGSLIDLMLTEMAVEVFDRAIIVAIEKIGYDEFIKLYNQLSDWSTDMLSIATAIGALIKYSTGEVDDEDFLYEQCKEPFKEMFNDGILEEMVKLKKIGTIPKLDEIMSAL